MKRDVWHGDHLIVGIWQFWHGDHLIVGIWQFWQGDHSIVGIWQFWHGGHLIVGIWHFWHGDHLIVGIWHFWQGDRLIVGIWQFWQRALGAGRTKGVRVALRSYKRQHRGWRVVRIGRAMQLVRPRPSVRAGSLAIA